MTRASTIRRRLIFALIIIAVGYLVLMLVVWGVQRSILFPAPQSGTTPNVRGATVLQIDDPGHPTVFALYVPARIGSPTVVHFHGNAQQISDLSFLAEQFRDDGIGFLAVEYPGYGLASSASVSEQSINRAADVAIHHLQNDLGIDSTHIILEGQSLGTGVAMEMASRGLGSRLILISPFTSVTDIASKIAAFLPMKWLIRDPFDSLRKAPSVHVPTLIIHGSDDEVIPVTMGQRLGTALPTATVQIVAGAHHNDLFSQPRFGIYRRIRTFVTQGRLL